MTRRLLIEIMTINRKKNNPCLYYIYYVIIIFLKIMIPQKKSHDHLCLQQEPADNIPYNKLSIVYIVMLLISSVNVQQNMSTMHIYIYIYDA